jgi:carboxylate-amine ligase
LRTVGVEEELLLVDAATGAVLPDATTMLAELSRTAMGADEQDSGTPRLAGPPGGTIEAEFQEQQLETATRPVQQLERLREELRHWRRVADDAAALTGARVAALGTSPLAVVPKTTESARYQAMRRQFGLTAAEQLTCGCHVHVSVHSEAEGVAVLDRIRIWLPTLLALSANSPMWQGVDSGFASFRSQAWNRWPCTGPTDIFGSAAAYHSAVESMIATQVPLDQRMVYFDARLSPRYPTVEVRVADVCLRAEDAVLLAALTRALVATAADEWRHDLVPPPVPTAVLRLGAWRAGRFALDGQLLDPWHGVPGPAWSVVWALYEHVRAALEDAGDDELVRDLLVQVSKRGNGAHRQRAVVARSADVRLVVRDAIQQTQL